MVEKMKKTETVASRRTEISGHVYKVFPNDLNSHQTAFGGIIMAECDRLALVVAERHSGLVCVTASVDSMHFLAPAKENDTLIFYAAINRSWNSSMEIGVKVDAENSYSGEAHHVVSAYFTFVAFNENNQSTKVPELIPESDIEKQRYKEAGIRREQRLKTRDLLKK
jgi:acyl-CoA hydrolase